MPELRRLAVAAGLLGALTGCATIPDGGPVHTGRALAQSDAAAGQIGGIPCPPLRGMPPAQAIRGFLCAAALPSGQDVARLYLTPQAQSRWRPAPPLTVYDDHSTRLVESGAGRWQLQARRLAVLGPTGRWTQQSGPLNLRFRLAKVGGQWRIASPPSRQVLASTELTQFYGRYDAAFVSPATRREVATPVVLPLQASGLATLLVRALLAGPPRAIASAVATAGPPAPTLIGNTTVSNGTASVDFTPALRGFGRPRLQLFGAQLLATLRQLPGIRRVRILADRAELIEVSDTRLIDSASPVPARLVLTQPTGTATVRSFAPPAPGRAPTGHTWQPLLGERWPRVTAAVLRGDGQVVAAARSGRTMRLLVGRPTGRPVTIARAAQLQPLQAAGGSVLVLVDGMRVAAVTHRQLQPLVLPARDRRSGVSAAALAPDGVQLALVAGPPGGEGLLLGSVRPDGRVVGVRRVDGLGPASGVAWTGPSQLTVVEARHARLDLVSMDTAGFAARRSSLPDGGPVAQLCAAPGTDPVVVRDGEASQESGGRWLRLGAASSCAFAG